MFIKEAVEKRIVELCSKRGIAINALANISGVSPSTVYSIPYLFFKMNKVLMSRIELSNSKNTSPKTI